MNNAFVDLLHTTVKLKKGELFASEGQRIERIGFMVSGVARGFVIDDDGNEVTTHFYMEDEIILGNFIPNLASSINIQALSECTISTANYEQILFYMNKSKDITNSVHIAFHRFNTQLQSRLVSLINHTSLDRYKLFLKEYPNLINRIPHYHIACFLGITPTQLSRARKQFSQQM